MADVIPRDRLLPYLLDRLTNDAPKARQESLSARTWSLRQSHQAVVRDLDWLLNSSAPAQSDDVEKYPEVARSVLNYGLPDITGLTASGVSADQLKKMLVTAITRFEPRILKNTLTVAVLEDVKSSRPNSVVLEIRGEIWGTPMPDSLYLQTEVDLESGHCHLQDKQRG